MPPSPWTSLLQSLHSALIDEVTDRHPEPKPELGLPKKFTAFQFPSQAASRLFWVKTSFPDSHGAVLIAYHEKFFEALKLDAAGFWDLISKRAVFEFTRRQIAPVFEVQVGLVASGKVPVELGAFPRVVWIPIILPSGECWFGIAA
jgi:hypothetical protein